MYPCSYCSKRAGCLDNHLEPGDWEPSSLCIVKRSRKLSAVSKMSQMIRPVLYPGEQFLERCFYLLHDQESVHLGFNGIFISTGKIHPFAVSLKKLSQSYVQVDVLLIDKTFNYITGKYSPVH